MPDYQIDIPDTASRITARELNRDVSAAKRAAEDGPVLITKRGRPTHLLVAVRHIRAASVAPRSIYDMLHPDWLDAESNDFDWEPERDRSLPRQVRLD
ncbi:MAG: hypothetical protein LBO20_02530 [Bifidobacteriaceae bacterium]|jgi:antitoxin (DNA-binding transcriptional repressor) of toxin-antitoxin stability system|nr:hypothetical protein [Bifidobacteriaceae bacterium]